MEDKQDLIDEFSRLTGLDRDSAAVRLAEANWDLEKALKNESHEEEEEMDLVTMEELMRALDFFEFPTTDPQSAGRTARGRHEFGRGGGLSQRHNEGERKDAAGSSADPQILVGGPGVQKARGQSQTFRTTTPESTPPAARTSRSRFRTIGSLHAGESSDEEGEAFYAGGSDRSGQQILGPRRNKSEYDFVHGLFQSARRYGAEQVAGTSERLAFHGTGYRLGQSEGPLESVAGPSTSQPKAYTPQQVDMILKMWRKGFSVDSGNLRLYDDETNREFIDSISRGEIPQELINLARGREVNLTMEDHRRVEFVKSKATVKAFSGVGHMLGSPTPALVAAPGTEAVSQEIQTSQTCPPASIIHLDPSKPVTTLQIRLADGSKIVAKFNMSHTIADVTRHIIHHPEYSHGSFILMTTFPNRELRDETQTLEEAKLSNAVIVQQMK